MEKARKLIQTEKCNIIYGDFNGEPNQELFRCPRELESDLFRYINEHRCLLHFVDDETENVREVDGKKMIGYYRMYFRDGCWSGRWLLESNKPTKLDCHGVQEIINYFCETFKHGCSYDMEEYFQNNFKGYCNNKRFLVKPYGSEYYKVMIDTTYGNGDYPVRIYVYKEEI